MFQCFARSLRLIVEIIMACSLHDMQVFFVEAALLNSSYPSL